MNKQKAIKIIQQMAQGEFYRTGRRSVHIDKIVELINQIDEPQKATVPKFVAEWYESNKFNLEDHISSLIISINDKTYSDEFTKWFDDNYDSIQTLINVKQFGYEIKQEKLYTVEIPNPSSDNLTVLEKLDDGTVVISQMDSFPVDWRNHTEYQLTETEIRKYFEWAWQFAKEVE